VNVSLRDYMASKKVWLEEQLPNFLKQAPIPGKLKESMIYSLMAGGKRIRPILLFATLDALGCREEKGLSTAIGLEMIHTYSLIHDDLPAMDNDDLRRGKPTNHVIFGEATAILAGDGLLTAAFDLVAGDPALSADVRCRILQMLANAAGPEGMVGGQEDDLEAEEKSLSIDELMSVHRRKTGRLICFPVAAAAVIAGAPEHQQHALEQYARHLGLAFQIGDDILDISGSEKELGKPIGSDLANHKNTYVSLLTMAGARKKLEEHVAAAKEALNESGVDDDVLSDLADYLRTRTH
jgi:geranylgeranyl diphosphate synthase type II